MTPEDKELLERTLSLTEENNEMLRGIQRSMRLARFMTILYWLFIVGAFAATYYFIQPYLESLWGVYGNAKEGTTGNFRELIDFIKQN